MTERPNNGEAELAFTEELNQGLDHFIATHAIAGQLIMETTDGERFDAASITLDHQKVGALLRPDGDHGFAQLESTLYTNLSPEQEALRQLIEDGKNNPDIDLF